MKKKITYKAFIVALKKKIKLNTFLRFFQTFSRSGKFLGKFQDYFKDSRLCMNLGYITLVITMSNQAKGNLHYEMILT